MNKNLRVKCPQCETMFNYYESEFRPFCSERCKLIDLGHWFKESYRVPTKEKNPTDINEYEENEKDPENYEQSYQEEENDYDENDYE